MSSKVMTRVSLYKINEHMLSVWNYLEEPQYFLQFHSDK